MDDLETQKNRILEKIQADTAEQERVSKSPEEMQGGFLGIKKLPKGELLGKLAATIKEVSKES